MILIATDRKFWLGQGGSDKRMLAMTRFLHRTGYRLAVFFAGSATDADRRRFAGLLPGTVFSACAASATMPLQDMRGLPVAVAQETNAEKAPPTLDDFTDTTLVEAFEALVSTLRPQAVIVQCIRLVSLVSRIRAQNGRPALLLDTLDVMSERCASFARIGRAKDHWIAITPDRESAAIRPFDAILAIQEQDAATLRKLSGGGCVLTVKHAPEVTPCRAAAAVRRRSPVRLLFLSAADPSNVDAARFLLDDIMPRITATCQLILAGFICGALAPEDVRGNVSLIGPVEDLDGLYGQIDMVINPVRAGGGLKIKNVEALAFGKPVITSPAGAIGLDDAVASGALIVCRDAPAYAACLAALASDPARLVALSRQAAEFAAARLAPEVVYAELSTFLSSRGIRPERPRGDETIRSVRSVEVPLVLTSGGGQLIAQLAVMTSLGLECRGSQVYYLGIQPELVGPYLAGLCDITGMRFMGELVFRYRAFGVTDLLRPADCSVLLRRGRGYLRHIHQELNPHLKPLQHRHIVMAARHKMLMDPYLVTALNPRQVTFTADGVVDAVEGWDFTFPARLFIHPAIRRMPTTAPIHTPAHLTADTARLGEPRVVAPTTFTETIARAAATPSAERFLSILVGGTSGPPPDAIVFSQHLALSGLCGEDEETSYYADVVRDLLARGAVAVLVKPHPRDPRDKLRRIETALVDCAGKFQVLDELLWGVPIEVATLHLRRRGVMLTTASSAAPLAVRSNVSRLACYDCPAFTEPFRREIQRFAQRHQAELRLPRPCNNS